MSRLATIEQPWQRWLIRLGVFVAMAILCVPGLWVVLTAFRPQHRDPGPAARCGFRSNLTLENFPRHFRSARHAAGPAGRAVLPQLAGHLDHLDGRRHRHRHDGRLRLCPLPLQGQGDAVPRLHAEPHRARRRAVACRSSSSGRGSASSTRSFGMILVYMAINIPFTIWLIDGFFRQIPVDLSEAAQIDGCTRWQAFWKVEFPLARSGPRLGRRSSPSSPRGTSMRWPPSSRAPRRARPCRSACWTSPPQFTIDWRGMSALAVLMIIPALVLTFIVQKHLIAGLTFGGVKG